MPSLHPEAWCTLAPHAQTIFLHLASSLDSLMAARLVCKAWAAAGAATLTKLPWFFKGSHTAGACRSSGHFNLRWALSVLQTNTGYPPTLTALQMPCSANCVHSLLPHSSM